MDFAKSNHPIENPSADFQTFLNDYFTGSPMIRYRLEEDITVWDRLEGQELETAKQMIFANLGHDCAYVRAIEYCRDARGIPLLENLLRTNTSGFHYERLCAARALYDWIGYAPYLDLLQELLPQSGSYTKSTLDTWIHGLDKALATHYIFLMLRDEDSFVRWCAFGTLTRYFHIKVKDNYAENTYYTGDAVYHNQELFEARLKELEERIAGR